MREGQILFHPTQQIVPQTLVADKKSPATPVFSEKQFQQQIRQIPWFKEFVKVHGEEPNLNDPQYDYRKAWAAGIRPQRDPYDQGRFHWPSALPTGEMLKSPDHPTAWKEHYMRATGKNPDAVGATLDDWLKMSGNK